MLVPLQKVIAHFEEDKDLLEQFLSSFSCSQDKDIESFLHNKAVQFEKLSKSRTYLICNETEFQNNRLEQITIYGYISVTLKNLSIPDNASNRTRKSLDGFSSKIRVKPIRDIPCYLIGQLSRNSKVSKDSLNGSELICHACDVISQAVDAVGGRYVMIECRDEQKLIYFYRQNLFKEFARIPDKNIPMVQMIRKIP